MADVDLRAEEFVRHANSYHRFMLGLKWALICLATVISSLVVAFASPGGIIGGLVVGALVFCLGFWAMNHGLSHSSERDNPGAGMA
jgi:lipopolysaccharide export LptBFGC system permease protein LptF